MDEMLGKNGAEAVFDEGKENTPCTAENGAERVKPYKLRELCAEDIFPMLNILKKIGIKEFKEVFSKETLENIVGVFVKNENGGSDETSMAAVGFSVLPSVLDIVDVLLNNIPKCEDDFYKFLSNISDLSIEDIKKLSMADFMEMIVDVIKKDEFKDFIKVVSTFFK